MDTLFSFRYMRVLTATLLVMIIIAVGAAAVQTLNWTWFEDNYATIDVEGVAEVTAVPDVATFNFVVEAEGADVAEAQKLSGEKINDIMGYLEGDGGVAETDIKTTGYNAYPRYEYNYPEVCPSGRCSQERELTGYVVTQTVHVKVRDTGVAGTLIGEVGARGATNMSGLSFEVDDLEGKKEEARLAAIADAKEKAERLADELDVRLGDILNFYDGGGGGYYPEPYFEARTMALDMAVEESAPAFAPEISVGEDTITAIVTITYKLK